MATTNEAMRAIADALMLGGALDEVRARFGGYDLLDHWKQGEFHHDVVVRVAGARATIGGEILVIATNCNGGVKEVLCFDEVPDRWALWHWRCPHVADFSGALPPLRGRATTEHWFDPCELLGEDTRSELRSEFRERQRGGGWTLSSTCSARTKS